jgi:hypothetical protein
MQVISILKLAIVANEGSFKLIVIGEGYGT